jgi:hypothetical protein
LQRACYTEAVAAVTEEDGVRVPMKVDYGVRALIDLAERLGAGPLQASEVAARQNVPGTLPGLVAHTLQKLGFVKEVAGNRRAGTPWPEPRKR